MTRPTLITFAILVAPLAILAACSRQQGAQVAAGATKATTAINRAVTQGQLFCQKEQADQNGALGAAIVAVVDAAGAPVIATNATANFVSATCAAINGIPTPPPANPAAVPAVVAPVAASAGSAP